MSTKIYISGGAINIEGVCPEIQSINSSAFDWQVKDSIYYVKDKIEERSYKLGYYTNVVNIDDIVFGSDRELIDFLNSCVNVTINGGSLVGTTVQSTIKDILGNDILGTVFGDLVIGTRVPSIAAQFQHGLNVGNSNPKEDAAEIVTANGGTVTIVNSELILQSGTASNGFASIQSNDFVRYLPGFEMWVTFTTAFETPDINGDAQCAGLFDSQNGFFLKYDTIGFYFVRRKLGVDVVQLIDIATIFPDGSFNPEKGNIYMMKYGYLGFATIAIVAANPNNGFNQVAKLKYSGIYDTIHTAQTFLPLRAEVQNTGATTNKRMVIGSVAAGIVDGVNHYPATRFFTERFVGSITSGSTLVALFRSKTTFASIENRIKSQLLNMSAAFDGTKPLQIAIKRNPVITLEGTFNNVDPNSIFEVSTDSTIDTNTGRYMKIFDIGKAGQIDKTIKDLNVALRAGEWASIELVTTGSGDYTAALRWEEQF